MSLRIGLVGGGAHARSRLLPALRQTRRASLVGVADPSPAARAACSAVPTFPDIAALLAAGPLDAVLIAAPPAEQPALAAVALVHGVHVYLEKPGALEAAELRDLARLALARDRRVALGFNYRFLPAHADLAAELRSGHLGRPVVMQSLFTSPTAGGWRTDPSRGGGALRDLASHEIDLARWLFADEIESVQSSIQSHTTAADTASLELRFRRGGIAQIFAAFGTAQQARIELIGERGRLSAARWQSLAAECAGPGATGPLRGSLAALSSLAHPVRWWRRTRAAGGDESRGRALAAFLDLIQHGTSASPTLADGIACLEVVAAAEDSDRTGRRVQLSVL
jgi:predicted dehydrogenase